MKRLPVVEDDKDILELGRCNLENDGFQVAWVTDGLSGLAQLRSSTPDEAVVGLEGLAADIFFAAPTLHRDSLRAPLNIFTSPLSVSHDFLE